MTAGLVIKKIIFHPLHPGRVTLVFPGFVWQTSVFLVDKFKLKEGMSLKDEKWNRLVKDEVTRRLKEKALRLLATRPRSRHEIICLLKKFWEKQKDELKIGHEVKLKETAIREAIAYLEDNNLINDREFALWWIEQRHSFRPRSRQELEKELRGKGIGSEDISTVFQNGNFDEKDIIHRLLEKKWRLWQRYPPKERKRKAMAYLGRKGFSYHSALSIIDEMEKRR